MGAGKSSVGRALASYLKWRFVDLDRAIERREGAPVRELFRKGGEAGFRRSEADTLVRTVRRGSGNAVIALGGGAYVQPGNAKLLSEAGIATVFLDTSFEEISRRCARRPANRPLFADANQFRQLYEERRSSYMQADVRIATDGKSAQGVAAEIARIFRLDGSNDSTR